MKTIYHLNENKNAEAKYCANKAAAGEAGLLCDVSACRFGAETSAAAPQQGNACVSGNYGGTDRTRRECSCK